MYQRFVDFQPLIHILLFPLPRDPGRYHVRYYLPCVEKNNFLNLAQLASLIYVHDQPLETWLWVK